MSVSQVSSTVAPTNAHPTPHGDDRPDHLDGFETIANELGGWWEVERARFIRSRLRRDLPPQARVLDVGCGPATMLGAEQLAPDAWSVSCDSFRYPHWRSVHPHGAFVVALADRLPFRDGAFDVVASFDVLEHLADDRAAMAEQVRVCAVGGRVASAVPAFPALWSAFDESVGHHRRYTPKALTALAESCGLRSRRRTAFFSWLFVPAWLVRNRPERNSEPGTGKGPVAQLVRAAVAAICAVERGALRFVDLPVGTSLWAEFDRSPRPAARSSR